MKPPGFRKRFFAVLLLGITAARSVLAEDPPQPAAREQAAGPKEDDSRGKASAASQEKAEAEARAAMAVYSEQFGKYLLTLRESLGRQLFPAPQVDPEMIRPHYEAEFSREFRPLVTTELRFIETVCRPTPEQRSAILAEGEESLQSTVKAYADVQVKLEQGGYRSQEPPQWPNPRKLIQEAMAQAGEKSSSADQATRYRQSLESRVAARKRATILYVVAKLDKALLLSDEQRDRVLSIMDSGWKDDWAQRLEALRYGEDFMFGQDYLPVLPDEQVLPILSETQREVWRKRNKKDPPIGGWTGFGFFQPAKEDRPEADPVEDA